MGKRRDKQYRPFGQRVHLVSFGDRRLRSSAIRLKKQVRAFGVFSKAWILDERRIKPKTLEILGERLDPNLRGFGFWIWKPFVILQCLEELRDGEILLYLDVGCHLNPAGRPRFLEYLNIVKKSPLGVIGFQHIQPGPVVPWDGRELPPYPDRDWAKGDLLDFFEVRDKPEIIDSPTIGAGVILIRKSEQSQAFLSEWAEIMLENPSLIDDSPSKSPNLEGFIENRHDQAVYSILAKKWGVPTLSAYEYYYPDRPGTHAGDWSALENCPIHAMGDKNFRPPLHIRLRKKGKRVFTSGLYVMNSSGRLANRLDGTD